MKAFGVVCCGQVFGFSAQTAGAQSTAGFDEYRGGEARVMVGISVPLGDTRPAGINKPRLDIS